MASKSSSATKKRTKKLQTFKDDYTAKWMCIISSKKSVNHARCTVCAYDFAIGHGGANDVLYGLITLSNWKKALSTDEHTCTGRKMLKISANAHARGNCTCNFSIAQKITDFVSKLLILSFIITGLCSGKLASLYVVWIDLLRWRIKIVHGSSQGGPNGLLSGVTGWGGGPM